MICEHKECSSSWVIVHNLNTLTPLVECWVDIDGAVTRIFPVSITPKDQDTIEVVFLRPYTGYVQIAQQKLWSDR